MYACVCLCVCEAGRVMDEGREEGGELVEAAVKLGYPVMVRRLGGQCVPPSAQCQPTLGAAAALLSGLGGTTRIPSVLPSNKSDGCVGEGAEGGRVAAAAAAGGGRGSTGGVPSEWREPLLPRPSVQTQTVPWCGPCAGAGPGCVPAWRRCRSPWHPWPCGSGPCQ